MNIELKKFGTALISRQAGKEAFAAFQSYLKDIPEKEDTLADFNGVITFSPSWGDEFLTQLAQRYDGRFKLMPTQNPSVKATIEILEKSNDIKFSAVE